MSFIYFVNFTSKRLQSDVSISPCTRVHPRPLSLLYAMRVEIWDRQRNFHPALYSLNLETTQRKLCTLKGYWN